MFQNVYMCFVVESGHDSKEDAVTCMELMLYKVKNDAKKMKRHT